MASLAGAELYKYDYRAEVFLRKYRSREPFSLTNGKKAVFIPDESVVELIRTRKPTTGVKLLDEDGKNYSFSNLEKTSEFGGRIGEKSPLAQENRALSSLRNQIESAKSEQATSDIEVVMKNTAYRVAGVESTPGTPKADFHLTDVDGKEVAWISHKAGRGPFDFQQYGGISKSREPHIFSHVETQGFIKDLQREFPGGLPRRTAVFRKIYDPRLKLKAIYGQDHGRGLLGRQNVTALIQGDVRLKRRTSTSYELDGNSVHYNGDPSIEKKPGYDPVFIAVPAADYDPVFLARYQGDRSDGGVKGTRIMIAPIGSRRAVEFPYLN